ncbi:MAG TPA: indole-3-glycerol phosphate synthase TrpC [Gemmatimonadales bacterium]|nr:indole-3-glycerol phosphate synthase TrpC [Gemmatimonadales bacterium]
MSDNPLTLSLDAILAVTRTRVQALKRRAGDLERQAAAAPPVRPFQEPTDTMGLIAEVKRRSPSQGDIRPDLDPVRHARAYVRGGAVAVSVLTDDAHFGGSIEDLERVAAAVPVPVLRKDFILDELQIMEARAAGASAVLLIVRALAPDRLRALARAAAAWHLPTLIEVHSAAELEPALAAAPGAIGVNARDLSTFAVDLRAAEAVIRDVPGNTAVVAESGINSRADVERVAAAGADFVLVGTSVARQSNPEQAVRELVGVKRHAGVRT